MTQAQAYIFQNASELNAAWQGTFGNGEIRGGELARPIGYTRLFQQVNVSFE